MNAELKPLSKSIALAGMILAGIALIFIILSLLIPTDHDALLIIGWIILPVSWVCIGINLRRQLRLNKAKREELKVEETQRNIARLERELKIGEETEL